MGVSFKSVSVGFFVASLCSLWGGLKMVSFFFFCFKNKPIQIMNKFTLLIRHSYYIESVKNSTLNAL